MKEHSTQQSTKRVLIKIVSYIRVSANIKVLLCLQLAPLVCCLVWLFWQFIAVGALSGCGRMALSSAMRILLYRRLFAGDWAPRATSTLTSTRDAHRLSVRRRRPAASTLATRVTSLLSPIFYFLAYHHFLPSISNTFRGYASKHCQS